MSAPAQTESVALPRAGSAQAWVLAARPKTLAAAFVPVAVGTAVAAATGGVQLSAAAAALFGALCIQVGTNFANDVFDAEKGADTAARVGPTRAVQAGLVSARSMRMGMIAAFGLATLAGIYLTWLAGWPVVAIGVASIASGILYTGGPRPLGYAGLGDVFVFVFFGIVAVAGTAFVQTGGVAALALAAAIPVGALSTAILVVNNARDAATDVLAGKRTLAVRFGRRFAIAEYVALLVIGAAGCAACAVLLRSPLPLLPLLLAPEGVRLARFVARTEGAGLNRGLAETARLLAGTGALLSIGLLLAIRSGG